jgi:hypothetical protein
MVSNMPTVSPLNHRGAGVMVGGYYTNWCVSQDLPDNAAVPKCIKSDFGRIETSCSNGLPK